MSTFTSSSTATLELYADGSTIDGSPGRGAYLVELNARQPVVEVLGH